MLLPRALAPIMLIVIVAATGCTRGRVGGPTTNTLVGGEERPTLGAVCTEACSRYDACQPDPPSAGAGVDEPAHRFVFDCSPACQRATEPATDDAMGLLDCTRLSDCTAFLSCVGVVDEPPATNADDEEAEPNFARRATDACTSVCERADTCRPDGDDVDTCVATCRQTQADDSNAVTACVNAPTCDTLLPCLDLASARTNTAEGLVPLGLDPVCVTLCDRTLTCGAEKAELDPQQLRLLSRDTDDAWMECALQCGQELHDDNRKAFDQCLATEECEKFLVCADEL